MRALHRFLQYISVHTGSDDTSTCTPSSPSQAVLAKFIGADMTAIGMENVTVTEHAYVYGFLPATPGYEHCKALGFNAHLDIVSELGDAQVNPQIIKRYDGGDIVLGKSGKVLSPEKFPHLKDCVGDTIITTDGTTVLGADDKAGIAAIMTMCQRLIQENIPHGKICVCFSPDEEIGHGAELLDLEFFGADYGFTVDGSGPEGIEYETFNAAAAHLEFTGFAVHPGEAKDTMINASLLAMEYDSMIPAGQKPSDTEGYEGYWHLVNVEGSTSKAKSMYIIRDHDADKFQWRQDVLVDIAKKMNEKYGEGTVDLTLKQEYRNMAEVILRYPELLVKIEAAIRSVGLTPVHIPVRGGTDGAQLSFRGLPCPNLGAGGYAFHGPYEHLVEEELEMSVQMLINLVGLFAEEH